MRLSDGDVLDNAVALINEHSWREPMPDLTREQVGELVAVLMPLYQRTPPKQKPAAKAKQTDRRGSEGRARRLVSARSGGLCEICTLAPAREWHHRKNRSQGGMWAASNGMHLCTADHAWITEHPEQAAVNGWTVRSYHDPAVTTCLRRGKWVLLKDDGSVESMEEVA